MKPSRDYKQVTEVSKKNTNNKEDNDNRYIYIYIYWKQRRNKQMENKYLQIRVVFRIMYVE